MYIGTHYYAVFYGNFILVMELKGTDWLVTLENPNEVFFYIHSSDYVLHMWKGTYVCRERDCILKAGQSFLTELVGPNP